MIAGVALLGFIIWVTSVVVQVQRQRQALEARIGWIFAIQALQESPTPEKIRSLHQQQLLLATSDETAKAVMIRLEPLWLEPQQAIEASRLQASLGVIRGANAQTAARLGRSWDVLYALALISCLLGIGVVVLVWRARRQREALLEPFAQGDASTTRRRDGAGLGLAVCSSLARRMGGELHIQSGLGQGLEAWVSPPQVG